MVQIRLNAEQARLEVLNTERDVRYKVLYPVIKEILDFLSYISDRPDFRFSGQAHARLSNGRQLLDEKDLKYYNENIHKKIVKNGTYEISLTGLSFSDISLHIKVKMEDFKPLILVSSSHSYKNAIDFPHAEETIIFLLEKLMQYRIKS